LAEIERLPLKDLVAKQIKEAIMAGELKPGERLTESGLGKRLRVSQATVREALIELEHSGFVERPAPRRTCVTVQTRRDTEEIYAIRVPLEQLAIDCLAKKNPNLDDVEKAAKRMQRAAAAGTLPDFLVADLSFHEALWKATENSHLEEILGRLVGRGFAFSLITARQRRPSTAKLKVIGEMHMRIVQLIRDGEIDEAKKVLEASMDRTWIEEVNLVETRTPHPGRAGTR
jgi:GntR family transcriptional regulator, gluconate operon transcriptional repressor